VRAVWDDTLQCKKAAHKCGADLALRGDSSLQPNLRKDYRHVLLSTF
jgi:hypothetical protein